MTTDPIATMLAEVECRGLRLDIDLREGLVLVRGPKGALDYDLRARLRALKPTVLGMLTSRAAEFDDLAGEIAADRDWCRIEGLLLPGEPDGAGYLAAITSIRKRRGLLAAWSLVVAHYASHVVGDLPRGPIEDVPSRPVTSRTTADAGTPSTVPDGRSTAQEAS